MLLAGRDLLFNDPFAFVLLFGAVAVALLISISVHEASHAAAALSLGDSTAKRLGRLTLNPKAHLDPTGTVMLLLAGFGWGKPVPVNAAALRNGHRSMALVSFAGPASNVVLALAFAAVFRSGVLDFDGVGLSLGGWLALVAFYSVTLNLILAVFNLLPIAPLDGAAILRGVSPDGWAPAIRRMETAGPIVLLAVIALQFMGFIDVLGFIFDPVIDFARALIGA